MEHKIFLCDQCVMFVFVNLIIYMSQLFPAKDNKMYAFSPTSNHEMAPPPLM